jgi:phosphate:Na+ symporter
MEIFKLVALVLSGIGAFLVGFKLMSDNMEKLFGSSLKALFNKTSDKRMVNVGMGAVVTAVIQSSGVTTVMVVGFVNAGIMTLYQAASIIMGANIGTTITAQIAALDGLPINSIFLLLLGIGVFMEMFSKNEKVKAGGLALAGLGMVFLGLHVMKTAMEPLSENPAITGFLSEMTNPFVLLLFGIVFTTLMQSSSAVTTIIIGMASAGLVFGGVYNDTGDLIGVSNAVLYIILGSNIGSTTTALLSSAGTSVNARRASIIHLLFNTIGSLLIMVMLLVWSDFYQSTFYSWFTEPTQQIAMFHTAFNVICTLLFLPFTKFLVKASEILVPEKQGNAQQNGSTLSFMDKRFVSTPAVAIGQLKKDTFYMADLAMESLQTAFDGFINRDMDAIERVITVNETVAAVGAEICDYLVKVSAKETSLSDERQISALHSNVGDIARVSELAENLTKYTKREVRDNLYFSEGINEKLIAMHELLNEQYALVKSIVLDGKYALVADSDAKEEEIDDMRKALVAEHITRLAQGKCRPENNTVFINLVSNLERIGDHLNFIVHDSIDGK